MAHLMPALTVRFPSEVRIAISSSLEYHQVNSSKATTNPTSDDMAANHLLTSPDLASIANEGRFTVHASLCPTAPGQTKVAVQGVMNLSTLSLHEFVSLLRYTRRVAQASKECTSVERVALASDGGEGINLIPLHGLDKDWQPVLHTSEEYHATFPGYVHSKNGPRAPASDLAAIQANIVAVSGLSDPYNVTLKGDHDDDNLFARIVRGEMEQWRVWEDGDHVAFLTPFANTPGFTVLVPRRHLPSDIFRLDDDAYDSLIAAAHTVMGVLIGALGVERVGFIFEGFEIDYTHVKLIPVYEPTPNGHVAAQQAPFYQRYPGYVTTGAGPPLETIQVAKWAKMMQGRLGSRTEGTERTIDSDS